jgi:hypothetical protein
LWGNKNRKIHAGSEIYEKSDPEKIIPDLQHCTQHKRKEKRARYPPYPLKKMCFLEG